MYYTNGNYSMGGNFKIKKQAPMDDRSTVAKKIDLQNPNLFDGFTYNGMIVSVVDDTINNGIYRLEDKSTKTWVKEGATSSTVSFATEEEVVTGTIVDKAISPLRLKNNNYNKSEVDAKIDGLILQNTGYNVFELPDFKLGEETKTAERWTDGKPIWRKVIQVTGMPMGTKDVTHDIVGFSDIWIDNSKSFMYLNTNLSAPIIRSSGTATEVDSEVILTNNKNTIRLSSVYDFSGAVITICICFTKTNEDITTPVAQVPVILEGLSEIPSPKLGVETKTAMRHPISGKPLYTKTIDCGFLPATKTVKVIPLNITDDYDYVKVLTDASHVVIPNVKDFSFSVLMPWYTLESQIGAYIESNTIVIGVGMAQSNKKAYVTVEYTKTADTNATPAALIGGNGKDAYEVYKETTTETPIKSKVEWLESLNGKDFILDDFLTDFSINGKKFDSNGNIDLEGRGTMSSSVLNVETLTEFRHPTSGKPYYTKTIDFGALPNTTTKTVTHNVANIEHIHVDEANSYAFSSTNTSPINYPHELDSLYNWYAACDKTTVWMKCRFDRTNYSAIITIRYTKTTDTAESPVRLTGGFTLDDTIGALTINGKNFDAEGNVILEGLSELTSPKLNVETLTEHRHPVSGKPIYEKAFDFGTLPNITTKDVPYNMDCEWITVNYKSSYAYDPLTGNTVSVMNGNYFRMSIAGQNISCISISNVSNVRAIVVVSYTKTTDTAESPVKLVGSKDLFDTMKDNGFEGSYEDFLIEMKGPDGNSIVATDMLKLESSIEVTVGSGGDYPTINAALEFLSKNYYPVYKLHKITATIRVLTGFVMQEQVFIRGLNLSWITIVSDDESILVDNTSLVMDFSSSDYGIVAMPLFGISKGGCGPIINSRFTFDVLKPTGNKHGLMTIGAGSSAEILSGKGFIGAGNCGIYAERGSTILANGAILNASRVSGAYAANNSSIMVNSANIDDCGGKSIYAANGSTITANSVSANNAGDRAIDATNNSRIEANSASAINSGGTAIIATNCSVITAFSANATGSKNDGVSAIQGSEVSIIGGTVNSFTRYGVISNSLSRINATNVIIQNQTVGNYRFAVFNGSTILAKGINVTGGTTPVLSQTANTLTANGTIYQ